MKPIQALPRVRDYDRLLWRVVASFQLVLPRCRTEDHSVTCVTRALVAQLFQPNHFVYLIIERDWLFLTGDGFICVS